MSAWAQEENSSVDAANDAVKTETVNSSWRENTIARCEQQYSVEQCQDENFLEENFHVNTLEIAHRAAIRSKQLFEKAKREITLQYACNDSPKEVCEGSEESAQCVMNVAQTCAQLKQEAAMCIQSAKQGCASTANPAACFKQQQERCPSPKKQPVAQLLAKYPKLSASQKSQLITTAQTLEKKTGSWWSDLVSWIATPLR